MSLYCNPPFPLIIRAVNCLQRFDHSIQVINTTPHLYNPFFQFVQPLNVHQLKMYTNTPEHTFARMYSLSIVEPFQLKPRKTKRFSLTENAHTMRCVKFPSSILQGSTATILWFPSAFVYRIYGAR